MSEMVERVKEAIEDATSGCDDEMTSWYLEKAARAAIEAMREPTVEMQTAGMDAQPAPTYKTYGNIWRAMIDEALK